jgi:nucleotide-binding universal stress UspA family protein
MGRVVVGVDGSAAAAAALRWAVAHARADDRVEAWHAWHPGTASGTGLPPDENALEAAARTTLDGTVATAGGPVTAVLVRAVAASALIDAGRDADLLVVGGPPGSVSRYVVEHAGCPVVVVPVGSA